MKHRNICVDCTLLCAFGYSKNSKRTVLPLSYVHTGTHPCHGCRDFLQEFLTKSLCVTSEASLNFRFSPRNFATRNPRLADEPTSEPLAMARQQGWTRRKSRYRWRNHVPHKWWYMITKDLCFQAFRNPLNSMWCGENIKFKANLKGKFLNGEIQFQLRQMNTVSVLLGVAPPVSVTPRIITFLVGDSYEPSFPTVYGRGKISVKERVKKKLQQQKQQKKSKVRIFNQKKSRKKIWSRQMSSKSEKVISLNVINCLR